jgi:hypothetical protein
LYCPYGEPNHQMAVTIRAYQVPMIPQYGLGSVYNPVEF